MFCFWPRWATCGIILEADVDSEFKVFAMNAIREFLMDQKAELDESKVKFKRERDEADSPSKGGFS